MAYRTLLFACILSFIACAKDDVNTNDKLAPSIVSQTTYTPFQQLIAGTDTINPIFILTDNVAVRGYKFSLNQYIVSSVPNAKLPFIAVQNSNEAVIYYQPIVDASYVASAGVYQASIEAFDAVGRNTTFKLPPIYISTGSAPTINIEDASRIMNDTLYVNAADSLNFSGTIADTDTILKASIYSYNDSLKVSANLYSKNLDTTFASADSLFTYKWESFPSFSGFVIIVEDKLGNINAQYIPIKNK